jgi:uncharacterized membrane protein YqjE
MTLRTSLTNLAGDVLALLRTRFELVAAEFAQERARFFLLLIWSLSGFLLLLLGVLTLSFGVAVLFWDTPYRLVSIGAMAALYLLVGVLLLFKVRGELLHGATPFEASVEVFNRDLQSLRSARLTSTILPEKER